MMGVLEDGVRPRMPLKTLGVAPIGWAGIEAEEGAESTPCAMREDKREFRSLPLVDGGLVDGG